MASTLARIFAMTKGGKVNSATVKSAIRANEGTIKRATDLLDARTAGRYRGKLDKLQQSATKWANR
ncbi:hypothetical protein [Nocardia vulneris]|uniref:hypothetical protein n=1 Tax=Nocardia vulneris TaxID=1141657 RepID=UPI000B1BA4D6|nr:hypothetical protein [Nocardia vulneris]